MPYSILGFRLQRGGHTKQCLEVQLTGTFTRNDKYKDVDVKVSRHRPVIETSSNHCHSTFGINRRKKTPLSTLRFKKYSMTSSRAKSELVATTQ